MASDTENQHFCDVIDKAVKNYGGSIDVLEGAIGAYAVARSLGWGPVILVHQRSTIRKYEKILAIRFKDEFPKATKLARKSVAWRGIEAISNFWAAVRGEVAGAKNPELLEKVRS